ncbi:uncharacterized protein N7443_005988 [Penicillium atrosanguineum]|uniref:uncharacterized protein n=1 Tax=Penicillium atrosanguineum TaxID=1132637 RepID=UPI002384BCCA|nr:uncharacterized protein N7443_005988 [Penicillium atrosanguineum]KAJ5300986.1 hypothetical protein N7443_005988 [Penicillium atrosanguineum]
MRTHNSLVWNESQWASAATVPNRGAKSYTIEGGIRNPCNIRYPRMIYDTRVDDVSSNFTSSMVWYCGGACWEMEGDVSSSPPRGQVGWELCDLSTDQGENHDLEDSHKDK